LLLKSQDFQDWIESPNHTYYFLTFFKNKTIGDAINIEE